MKFDCASSCVVSPATALCCFARSRLCSKPLRCSLAERLIYSKIRCSGSLGREHWTRNSSLSTRGLHLGLTGKASGRRVVVMNAGERYRTIQINMQCLVRVGLSLWFGQCANTMQVRSLLPERRRPAICKEHRHSPVVVLLLVHADNIAGFAEQMIMFIRQKDTATV